MGILPDSVLSVEDSVLSVEDSVLSVEDSVLSVEEQRGPSYLHPPIAGECPGCQTFSA